MVENKKIAFFTEMGFTGKIARDHPNMRTEFAWMCALEADHIPLLAVNDSFRGHQWDLGIIIIPKKLNEHQYFTDDFWSSMKMNCKKVAIMQEGPHNYFQDYTVNKQIAYFNQLEAADFLLCHNQYDVNYYKGLTGKNVYPLQSLMITDMIRPHKLGFNIKIKDAVMIGGNFTSWYGGFDSWMIAREMQIPIYAPSMGRKQKDEEEIITEINYLPYMNWVDWMKELKKVRYGVHLMRTYAAGTFALNCAKLGVPCIGYEKLDTQRILHPRLTVDEADFYYAKKLAWMLVNDKDFYGDCVYDCLTNYENYYREDRFLEKFSQILLSEGI